MVPQDVWWQAADRLWRVWLWRRANTCSPAAKNAGSVDTDKVIAALEALKYDYYKGPEYYRKCDHQSVQSVLIIKSKSKRHEERGRRVRSHQHRRAGRSQPAKLRRARSQGLNVADGRALCGRASCSRGKRMAGLSFDLIALQLFTGLALGAIYVLFAIGLSLIFGMLHRGQFCPWRVLHGRRLCRALHPDARRQLLDLPDRGAA